MADIKDSRTLWHDSYCRAFLEDPLRAGELLRLGMAAATRAELADEPPLPVKTHYVQKDLKPRQLDFNFLFRRRRGGYLEFVLEHKSFSDAGTPGQLARYTQLALDSPSRKDVRQVMSAVLYHGKGRWTAPHALEWGPDGKAPARQEAGAFGYPLWNLMKLDLDRLPLSPRVWAGVAAMVGAFREEAREALLDRALRSLEAGALFTQQTLTYISAQWRLDIDDLQARLQALQPKTHTGGDDMAWTTLELAEASEAKGMAKTLLKLLHLKFKALPAEAETKVRAASAAQLDAWTEAVLTAASLDELLATAPKN